MAANARRREGSWWRKHYQPPRTPRIGYMKRLIAYHRGRARQHQDESGIPAWVKLAGIMASLAATIAIIHALFPPIFGYWPVGQ